MITGLPFHYELPDQSRAAVERRIVPRPVSTYWVSFASCAANASSRGVDLGCGGDAWWAESGFVWGCAPGDDRHGLMHDHRQVSESRAADGAETSDAGAARSRSRLRSTGRLTLLGPAFVAAVAYVDPGNVAANVQAGASYGYLLVWVLVVATAAAGVVQYLSAKLGLATGASLPELGRATARHAGPAGVLAAGRGRRDGHRPGRGDRRRRSRSTCCSTCRCCSAG